jgi:hypothetical protein
VTFILPVGKSVTVGDYISLGSGSGGVNPRGLFGVHKVSDWDSGTRMATVQVVFRDGASISSGTVTGTIDLIKTVLSFTGSNGIYLNGLLSGGFWIGLVIQGDDHTSSQVGINLLAGATLTIQGASVNGFATGVVGFGVGVSAAISASFNGEHGFISKHGEYGVRATVGGTVHITNAHVSGVADSGIVCLTNSTFNAPGLTIVGSGDYTVYALDGGVISLLSGYIDLNNATYAFGAFNRSTIIMTSSTFSDGETPATNGNNEDSWIVGP